MAGDDGWLKFLGFPPDFKVQDVPRLYRVAAKRANREFMTSEYLDKFMNPPRPTWTPRKDAAPAGRILDWSSISYPTAIGQPIPILQGAGRFVGQLIWVGDSTVTADYNFLGHYVDLNWNFYGEIEFSWDQDPDAAQHERRWGPLSESNANYLIRQITDVFVDPPQDYYKIWAVDRTYNGTFAVAFAEDFFSIGIYLLKLWAGDTLIWSAESGYAIPTGFAFTFYDGTGNVVDPTIEAAEGVGNVPTFNRVAYAVFTEFDPMKFNGTIPVISAQLSGEPWDGDQTLEIDSLLLNLAMRLGYDADDIEFIGTFPEQCSGWTLQNDTDYRSAILAICDFYTIMVVDAGESIRFVRTAFGGATPVDATLAEDELVARASGALVSSYRVMPTDLPIAFEVTYPSATKDYTADVALVQRAAGVYNTTPSKQKFSASSPVALTAIQAEAIASANLYRAVAQGERHSFSVGPEHIVLEPGDVVEIPVSGTTRRCQIIQVTINPDFTVDVEAEEYMADD